MSYRFPDIGSHFVPALVDVFREHATGAILVRLGIMGKAILCVNAKRSHGRPLHDTRDLK